MQATSVKKNLRGETLIELLAYIGIATIVLGAIMSSQSLILRARQRFAAASQVEEQAMIIMSTIGHTIRNSGALSTPTNGLTAPSLHVTTDVPATTPTVISLSGTTLQMTEGTGAAIALTPPTVKTASLSFQNISDPSTPGIVQVKFTLTTSYSQGGTYSHSYQASYARR